MGRRQLLDGSYGAWASRSRSGLLGSLDRVARRPERTLALHRAYIRAGASVLRTDSFALPAALAKGLGPAEAGDLLARTLELATLAREGRGDVKVLCSLGPAGDDPSPFRLLGDHLRNARAAGGIDGVILESFRSWRDLQAARNALGRFDGEALGLIAPESTDDLSRGVEALRDPTFCAIGFGCHRAGFDPALGLNLLARATELPLVLSLPCFGDGDRWAGTMRDCLATEAGRRVEYAGGCCGAGPAHVLLLSTGISG